MTPNEPSRRTLTRALAALSILLGVLTLGTRGIVPAFQPERSGNADWRLVYSTSRAWLEGRTPYVDTEVRAAFAASPGSAGLDPMNTRRSAVLVYPPPALAALAPLAALPWSLASPLWTLLSLACYALSIAAIASLASLRGPTLVLFIGLALMLAPVHTLIWAGQTAAPVLALVAAGSWLINHAREGTHARTLSETPPGVARRRRLDLAAGLLLGVATVLKPQLGLLFLVYHAGRLRGRVAAGGVAAIAALVLVGVLRLELAGVPWLSQWQQNIADFAALDDAAATSNNLVRHQLINLHYPLHVVLGDNAPVGLLVLGILGVLSLEYLLVDTRRGGAEGERRRTGAELISLSMVAAVTLAIAYHRIYDAVVLLFPLALVLGSPWRGTALPWRLALGVVGICTLSFLAPISVVLTEAARRGLVPAGVDASWLWRAVLVPSQAWAMLVLAVALVVLRSRARGHALTQRST